MLPGSYWEVKYLPLDGKVNGLPSLRDYLGVEDDKAFVGSSLVCKMIFSVGPQVAQTILDISTVQLQF